LDASSVLKLNLTESMPIGLYVIRRMTTVHVGDIVIACPPPAAQRVGIANGYLARASGVIPGSRCGEGSAPVLKYAIALGGDELEISRSGLSLNERLFDPRPKARADSRGRKLVSLPYGRYRLGSDDILLYSPAPCSWDSRYFGPIKKRDLQGIAQPIVTRSAARLTSAPC
jgi:conjugative transfer signal peptidase TraF